MWMRGQVQANYVTASDQELLDANCPFCQEQFRTGEVVVRCPADNVPHHLACWQKNGDRCTTHMCGGRGKAAAPEKPPEPPLDPNLITILGDETTPAPAPPQPVDQDIFDQIHIADDGIPFRSESPAPEPIAQSESDALRPDTPITPSPPPSPPMPQLNGGIIIDAADLRRVQSGSAKWFSDVYQKIGLPAVLGDSVQEQHYPIIVLAVLGTLIICIVLALMVMSAGG